MKIIRFPSLFRPLRGSAEARQIQHAALPFVETDAGLLVCLITSRGGGRWVIPKGWPKPGMAPHALAELEAYEEAGLQGRISKTPLGSFEYLKRLHIFSSVPCIVDVYPLRVREQLLDWPERQWRLLRWAPPGEAARLVKERGLAALISGFGAV